MPELGFAIELERNKGAGRQGFVRRLEGIERRGANYEPALRKIHKSYLAAERARFNSDGGGEWAPLAADTVHAKRRKGQDGRQERATGELQKALTTGRGTGAVTVISRDAATFGVDMKKAVVAQRGSGTKRRRLIVVSKRRRARWAAIIRKHVVYDE